MLYCCRSQGARGPKRLQRRILQRFEHLLPRNGGLESPGKVGYAQNPQVLHRACIWYRGHRLVDLKGEKRGYVHRSMWKCGGGYNHGRMGDYGSHEIEEPLVIHR